MADLATRIAATLRQAGRPPYAVARVLIDMQAVEGQLLDHLSRLEQRP